MSTRAARLLGRPYSLGSAQLANRIVMAPMTRYFSPVASPATTSRPTTPAGLPPGPA